MRRSHFAGIFLISFATLLLELALTRVLSVASWYHFGFLIISTALLGFAASGVVLTLWRRLRLDVPLDRALAWLCVGFATSTLLSFWTMQHIPFDPFSLLVDRRQLVFMPAFCVVLSVPFFFSGMAISLLFTRGSSQVNRLYAADLCGAGLGCAAIALLMPAFADSGTIFVVAVVGMLAGAVFYFSTSRGVSVALMACAAGVLVLAFSAQQLIPVTVLPSKRHPLKPQQQQPLYTAWDAMSRVDVYRLPPEPDKGRPDPGFSIIIDAGASGTAIADMSQGVRHYLANSAGYHPTGLAYVDKEHPNILVIGSGSGREVLEGLHFGAASITAVEINALVTDAVEHKLAREWGGLFQESSVHLVTEEGRSFVRRSEDSYDAIILVQAMSDAMIASGALTLSESYLLTVEAFQDYLRHLTPNGVLLITRPAFEMGKLFATAREALQRSGLGEAKGHLIGFRGPLAPFGHTRLFSGMLLKKSPFGPDQLEQIAARLGLTGAVGATDELDRPQIYYPPSPWAPTGTAAEIMPLLAQVVEGPDLPGLVRQQGERIRPARDDRPFFNHHVRWSQLRPYLFKAVLTARRSVEWESSVAEIALVLLLLQVAGVTAVLTLLPLYVFARQHLEVPGRFRLLTYFAGLGLGFIMIEIVVLQHYGLFLGRPTYTFAVVLAALLIFTGAGAALAGRLQGDPRRHLRWVVPGILAVLAATAAITPWLFERALGLSLAARIAIAVGSLLPLGLLLGMPFPLGVRLVASEVPALIPWGWAVNGFFTVIGSALALMLGMGMGFRAVLLLAAACYLGALAAVSVRRQRFPAAVTAPPRAAATSPAPKAKRAAAGSALDDPAAPPRGSPVAGAQTRCARARRASMPGRISAPGSAPAASRCHPPPRPSSAHWRPAGRRCRHRPSGTTRSSLAAAHRPRRPAAAAAPAPSAYRARRRCAVPAQRRCSPGASAAGSPPD